MWQPGTRVLATRLDDEFYYPGTVHQADAARWFVLFDDGNECWVGDDQLLPLQIDVGDRLAVRLPGGTDYTVCRVLRREGEKINVQFDDGSDEQTSLGMIRVDPTAWKDPRQVGRCATPVVPHVPRGWSHRPHRRQQMEIEDVLVEPAVQRQEGKDAAHKDGRIQYEQRP